MTAGSEPPPAATPSPPVVAIKVQVSDAPIVMTGAGTVDPCNVVDVHVQAAGTIQNIGFVESQVVKPGDLIAQINPRPYEAALQQDEAILQVDEAHLANAEVNLRRYRLLRKEHPDRQGRLSQGLEWCSDATLPGYAAPWLWRCGIGSSPSW
jgi:membrane fusion protein, multidrug efflux system